MRFAAAGRAPRGEMSYSYKNPIMAGVAYLGSEFYRVMGRMALRFAVEGGAPRGEMSYGYKDPIMVAAAFSAWAATGFWFGWRCGLRQKAARSVAT